MTRTNTYTNLDYTRRFDLAPQYNSCLVADCPGAGRYDRLCYRHLAESRRKLAVELRRLQRHHRTLQTAAQALVDLHCDDTVDVDDQYQVDCHRLKAARAVAALQRLLGPG